MHSAFIGLSRAWPCLILAWWLSAAFIFSAYLSAFEGRNDAGYFDDAEMPDSGICNPNWCIPKRYHSIELDFSSDLSETFKTSHRE